MSSLQPSLPCRQAYKPLRHKVEVVQTGRPEVSQVGMTLPKSRRTRSHAARGDGGGWVGAKRGAGGGAESDLRCLRAAVAACLVRGLLTLVGTCGRARAPQRERETESARVCLWPSGLQLGIWHKTAWTQHQAEALLSHARLPVPPERLAQCTARALMV